MKLEKKQYILSELISDKTPDQILESISTTLTKKEMEECYWFGRLSGWLEHQYDYGKDRDAKGKWEVICEKLITDYNYPRRWS